MVARLAHLQVNVGAANLGFYRDLLTYLGWTSLYDAEGILGLADGSGSSVWFVSETKAVVNDYDGPGVNHIAFSAASIAAVDEAAAFLSQLGAPPLFETPRHRPEFAAGAGQTYYQVMFASPDNLLFEVVYTGPKD